MLGTYSRWVGVKEENSKCVNIRREMRQQKLFFKNQIRTSVITGGRGVGGASFTRRRIVASSWPNSLLPRHRKLPSSRRLTFWRCSSETRPEGVWLSRIWNYLKKFYFHWGTSSLREGYMTIFQKSSTGLPIADFPPGYRGKVGQSGDGSIPYSPTLWILIISQPQLHLLAVIVSKWEHEAEAWSLKEVEV